jgi:hypothetical protein
MTCTHTLYTMLVYLDGLLPHARRQHEYDNIFLLGSGHGHDSQPPSAAVPTHGTSTEGPAPAWNTINGAGPSLQTTTTNSPTPSTCTDELRVVSTSSKSKGKKLQKQQKPNWMRATAAQTARYAALHVSQTDPKPIRFRNLFAIDYLKTHKVTREEFSTVWDALEDDLRQISQSIINMYPSLSYQLQVYNQREAAAKRKKTIAGSTSTSA